MSHKRRSPCCSRGTGWSTTTWTPGAWHMLRYIHVTRTSHICHIRGGRHAAAGVRGGVRLRGPQVRGT
eukprot:8689405-Pyramimonas_sp.AAC.1